MHKQILENEFDNPARYFASDGMAYWLMPGEVREVILQEVVAPKSKRNKHEVNE